MPTTSRLIIDPPLKGAWNMAVDEALLDSVADGGAPALRLYRWSEPTLSLGYFQPYADRRQLPEAEGLTVVRRSSGGGALVHHHELTYSLALPEGSPALAAAAEPLNLAAHRLLIGAISEYARERGATLALRLHDDPKVPPAPPPASEPFLCFLRRSEGDLLSPPAEGPGSDVLWKICGSAQRKRRGAVLQHGGVLLAASPHAPQLPGLRELGLAEIDKARLQSLMQKGLGQLLPSAGVVSELTPEEHAEAIRLETSRFSDRGWIERR
ncbi:Octanoyltransferase LipM [Pseudobythopirellula maris]|uniref:Octanoyltransferase LipM n=1 Tax=Pseudobythopirellula maris TaxID=2527991 RepID=A0A5C5ZGD1_9BACT|nr:lipoate--protein ligase family protein [Pseudobythopirellula maris]TWT86276.1 Octanoyltransferase LipM [Pseudobythopirellula maris]